MREEYNNWSPKLYTLVSTDGLRKLTLIGMIITMNSNISPCHMAICIGSGGGSGRREGESATQKTTL